MKKLFIAAAAAVCALSVSAQRASDSSEFSFWDNEQPEQSIVIGARVGMNVSSLSFTNAEIEGDKSKIGFNFGVAVELPIVRSFYINSGLFYTTKGIKFEDSGRDWKSTETFNAGYLELPVYASYRLNFAQASQLQINFGPYFAFGINGKVKEEYSEDGEKEKYSYDLFGYGDDKAGIKRFDCGLGVGLGYTINKIYLGMTYQFGLVNIADKKEYGDVKIKNSNFNISIGYNF